MTLTQRKLQEKILNSQNFFTNFLNSQNSWNSLLAIETLEPLQTSLLPTSLLPTSALGGSLWALFIAKAWRLYALDVFHVYAGDKFTFFFFISSHGQWVILLFTLKDGFYYSQNTILFFFSLDNHKRATLQMYKRFLILDIS